MRYLNAKLILMSVALMLSATASFALPNCPPDQTERYHNCFGTYTWTSGEKYVGEFRDDKTNGQGVRTYPNGNKYVGEEKDGKKDGQGTLTFANGDKYVGEFKDDKRNGQGTYTFADGEKYVGEFKDGKINGQGTYTFASGEKYVGEFRDDKTNGQGVRTYPNGSKYVGEEKDGKKDGQGTLTFANGEKYVGEFKDDKRNGQGFYIFKDGRADFCVYVDNKDSNCSGSNVYDVAPILTNNFRQLSEFKRKRIQSNLKLKGFYTSVVDGKWGRGTFSGLASYAVLNLKTVYINTTSSANDLLQSVLGTSLSNDNSCPTDTSAVWDNCIGTHIDNNGHKYVGQWKDDQQHGQGTVTFVTGNKYVGEWKDGKHHGQGTYTFADGENYVGEWKNSKNDGYGTYTWTNGNKYVGQWKDNEKHGQGTYIYADGTIKKGIWKDGEFVSAQTSPEIVKTDDPNETREVASGTGFYVSNDGHIITNYHVIDGCMDMKVHTKGRVIPTLRIADDELNDLALLKISETPSHVFALSNDSPFPLQEIVVAGFPFGESYSSSLKFTQGIISSLTGIGNNYSEMQIDAALQPGNSGGPIIDEYGNIVGVAVAKLDAKYTLDNFGVIPENTNFGIKASAVKNLLEGNQVPLKTPNTELISKRDLSRLATDGTVYLTCWMTSAQLEQMKSKKAMFENLK